MENGRESIRGITDRAMIFLRKGIESNFNDIGIFIPTFCTKMSKRFFFQDKASAIRMSFDRCLKVCQLSFLFLFFFFFGFKSQVFVVKAEVISPSYIKASHTADNYAKQEAVNKEIGLKNRGWDIEINIEHEFNPFDYPAFKWGLGFGIPVGIIIGLLPWIAIASDNRKSRKREEERKKMEEGKGKRNQ